MLIRWCSYVFSHHRWCGRPGWGDHALICWAGRHGALWRHPWKEPQTDQNGFPMKCPLPTPCNQVSEITDSLTHFLTHYPQLCWTLSTHRSKDTELKMLWLPFIPCSASVVSCFVLYFSGSSSPYETKQFLDASQIRSAHSVFFLCVSHPSGSWNLISGSAFWRFAWSLFMRFCQQVQFSSQMRNDVYQREIRSVIYQLSVVTWTMSIKTLNTHTHKEA